MIIEQKRTYHAGVMIADKNCAILGAMILGPICGLLWKHVLEPLTRKAVQGMEMLTRNLVAAIVGLVDCAQADLSYECIDRAGKGIFLK